MSDSKAKGVHYVAPFCYACGNDGTWCVGCYVGKRPTTKQAFPEATPAPATPAREGK